MRLTLFVPVALNIPVGEDIPRLVLLDTSRFNLLETPLRQVDVASAEVAVEVDVSETEGGSQSADLGVIALEEASLTTSTWPSGPWCRRRWCCRSKKLRSRPW